jgi:Lrp/AsnC family leucine-responsive transcriptional regulator
MTFQTEARLDSTDWAILRELQADARLSFSALGRRVNLSAPAVAERVRRLESAGVIAGYQARVDPARAGQPVAAFIQMRCNDERCLLRTTTSSDYPEVVEIHKLSGEYCVMLRVRATSMAHLEGLIERLGRHGVARSSVVMSTQFDGRPVEPPRPDPPAPTHSAGWRR